MRQRRLFVLLFSAAILCTTYVASSAYAQAPSIQVQVSMSSGLPSPQFSLSQPDIATVLDDITGLPDAPPTFPQMGRFLVFDPQGVPGFPSEIDVSGGVIRIFGRDCAGNPTAGFAFCVDTKGLESFLVQKALDNGIPVATAVPPQAPFSGIVAQAALPTSGSEPAYNPGLWNDADGIQHNNNCYNYGVNKMTNTYAQPGRQAMTQFYCNPPNMDCTKGMGAVGVIACNTVMASAIADGLTPWVENVQCPQGYFKAALVVHPGRDYHWYHQDNNGNWSHKPDKDQATNLDGSNNLIMNPRTADRRITGTTLNYTAFCGWFCVKANPALVNVK
jgi:hypothetical protein